MNYNDLIINEVLFNPPPNGSDYVELYNRTDSTVMLNRLWLAKWDSDHPTKLYPLERYALAAHDFVVITTDRSYVVSQFKNTVSEKVVEVSSMPSYNDDEGDVVLLSSDSTVIDRFTYNKSMHSPLLRDVEGVALERRSYNRPAQDAANWYSASSVSGYGTPTLPNSQQKDILFTVNDFAVSPTVFSPDDDGYNDLVDIAYQFALCDLSGNITVYDASGHAVRHLLRGGVLGCSGSLRWEGTDDNGNRCRQGKYIIDIDIFNTSGKRQRQRYVVNIVYR